MYADLIRDAAEIHIRSGQSDTSAEDLQAVFGKVAEAVETFEGVTRGAIIHHGAGAPDNGLGLDIDAYIDTRNTDLYIKEAGAWSFRLTLRGAPSTVPGPPGKEGLASTVPGPKGDSAYQVWLAAGNSGTQAQFLATLKGKDGEDGSDGEHGSRIRFESIAPTAEDGRPGDMWVQAISGSKYAIYECYLSNGAAAWRLRFTSPDPVTTTTAPTTSGGTVKSVNNVAPDAAGNVTISIPSGSGLPAQAGNAGKVLGTDGANPVWRDLPQAGSNLTKASGAEVIAGVEDTHYVTPKAITDASASFETYIQDIPEEVKANVAAAGNWDANNRYVGPGLPNGLALKVYYIYPNVNDVPAYKYEFLNQNKVVRIKLTN